MSKAKDPRQQLRELVAKQFLRDIFPMALSVEHDDGIYRHLKIRHPDTIINGFDIVTWPGHLAISGDMGTTVFSRVYDMFDFFGGNEINPGYWAGKVEAGETRVFDPDVFRQVVTEHVRNELASEPRDVIEYVTKDVEERVLNFADDGEHAAMSAAIDYRCPLPSRYPNLDWSLDWMLEADCTNFTHRFLWQCHAILWAVNRYKTDVGWVIDADDSEIRDELYEAAEEFLKGMTDG